MATQGKLQGEPTMKTERYEQLRTMLEERRREMLGELQDRIRGARTGRADAPTHVRDEAESSEAGVQEELEFALLQMKTETIRKIDEALARLATGTYGDCYECGSEIAERRLRALPFAVRCKDCEDIRETARRREQVLTERRSAESRFGNLGG